MTEINQTINVEKLSMIKIDSLPIIKIRNKWYRFRQYLKYN